jgi:glycerol uptake operon antiterminator
MAFDNQKVIPAARHVKDFELILKGPWIYLILLHSHVAQLQPLMDMARRHGKCVLIHADLVQGLKHDEAAAQYLCQVIKPYGIISTHSAVLNVAKKQKVVSVQRVFLLDSQSLETSYKVLATSAPDFVELIPGAMPHIIAEFKAHTGMTLLAGGFIRTMEDVRRAIEAGASAVTTSRRELWDYAFKL